MNWARSLLLAVRKICERFLSFTLDARRAVLVRGLGGTSEQLSGSVGVSTRAAQQGEPHQSIGVGLPHRCPDSLVLGARGSQVRLGLVIALEHQRQTPEVAEGWTVSWPQPFQMIVRSLGQQQTVQSCSGVGCSDSKRDLTVQTPSVPLHV